MHLNKLAKLMPNKSDLTSKSGTAKTVSAILVVPALYRVHSANCLGVIGANSSSWWTLKQRPLSPCRVYAVSALGR